jgi:putative tricarboxylic transport membrane protein
MLEGILIGLQTAMSLQNLLMVIGGCLIGTFIGMLPGLGPMSIIAIMIPVAISIGDPSAALILLAGVYYGAIFGGSTSSILLNAPGVAGTVASAFDGYPMARQGKAGKALTIAAISSFAGGTIGAILLMIFAPMLSSVALLFHSAEYFGLMIVGLSAIAAFAGSGQVAKALLMTVLGLIMATVGLGSLFNMPRFTGGFMELQSGFGFVTLAMAMFALPEAIFLVLKPKNIGDDGGEIKDLRITRAEAANPFKAFSLVCYLAQGQRLLPFLATRWNATLRPRKNRQSSAKAQLKASPRLKPPIMRPALDRSCRF